MLVKFPDEHWISLTQAGHVSKEGDLLKMMKNGEIEEHGDILGTDGKSQPCFAAFEELYSGKLSER